jgi:hypothetical protein
MTIDPVTLATSFGGWLWGAIGPSISDKALDAVNSRWKQVAWHKSEEKYRRRLVDLHSSTKLLGNPRPIRIDKIYTDVYVLNQITAYRRLHINKDTGTLQESTGLPAQVKRQPLLEIVRDRTRVYVLGKPGAGKSTFLKKLCLLCCNGDIPRTPIFVSLKEWFDTEIALEEFICAEFKVCGFPEPAKFVNALLQEGPALLLLDGLDEIPPDNNSRQKAITSLTRLARQYPTIQIVLTCRIAAAEYSFDQFDYYEVADFTEEQQNDFVDKWYQHDAAALQHFSNQWHSGENYGLRDLARTPLLLALLCLAFDETLSFPRRRVELYQEATNALLRKWDASRGIKRDALYRSLSHSRREQLLSRLAAKTFFDSQIFFPATEANRIIEDYLGNLPPRDESRGTDASDLLRAMEAQHGLLVERAVGIYSFSHLTIHEYFTARYLIESSHLPDLRSVVHKHFFEDSWREVFLMVASILDDATPLFESVEELFTSKFFMSTPIKRLLDYSIIIPKASSTFGSPIGSTTLSLKTDRGRISVLLRKSGELCETLAGLFHFIKCGSNSRSRAINAYPRIVDVVAADFVDNTPRAIKSAQIINEYLQACTIIIESMEIASMSRREEFVESLVFPALGMWRGKR